MASRALVLLAPLLIIGLLLLLLPAGAHAGITAGRRTSSSVRCQLRQKNEATGRINNVRVRSYGASRHGRKLGEKENVVDVTSHGAVGDGQQDDTPAFQKAWAAACSSSKPATLLVPKEKTYVVKQITFADGNGESWWKNSGRVDKNLKCTDAPMALLLSKCNQLKVENINLLNSQQIHMSVEDCKDVLLKRITVTALGDSPENDGIHIARTKDIQVIDCNIKTGDDCLSIETGTENMYASRITCGPGHGISVGSLGDNNSEARVSNVTVYKARLSGTMFGVRIKSWQGGKGYAKEITFEDITMTNVKNPIIVDQNYCTMADPLKPKACEKQTSAVEFSNIRFKNIRGTSATKEAIKLDCSDTIPCRDILLQDVNLIFKGEKSAATTSICNNVKLKNAVNVSPKTC
ncbi:unnamed protein product [Alopecurus aequalis]